MKNLLELTIAKHHKGTMSCDEIGLPVKRSGLVLPCGIFGRWES
jgi:23S rRNA (cytosine1962-C5)-methyltransferase